MEKKHTVGIFSRSDRKDYSWLITLLTSDGCSDWVQDVRPSVISNTLIPFIEDVSHCTFGILYHTKNRGAVNISDISGSLYNEEMKILYELLGKENVIVVIDDLRDSSDEEKRRILTSQPSIQALACDLLLISITEKKNTKSLMTKLRNLSPFLSASEKVSEVHKSHDALSCSSGRHKDYKAATSKYKVEDSETWNTYKKPEMSSRYKSPVTQNDAFETHENIYVPEMCGRPGDDEDNIYETVDNCLDSSESMKSFDNPKSWDSIENFSILSCKENPKRCDSTGSHETVDLYGEPETFETLHSDMTPDITFPYKPPGTKLYKEMLTKFASHANYTANSGYKNSETAPKSERPHTRSNYNKSETLGNNKSPKRHSNPQKHHQWLYNETDENWYRNEEHELPSNDNNPETPSTCDSHVPQFSKGNLRTQMEAPSVHKNPERRPKGDKPAKWFFNENDKTWQRN